VIHSPESNLRIVEAYKAGSSVEAHCIGQLLQEAGIKYQIAGENLASLYGIEPAWAMPSILVAEDDLQRARQLIADQLGLSLAEPHPTPVFRYGMRALLINLTLIAIIFGLYVPLGSYWPNIAYGAFFWALFGNVAAFAYTHKKHRQVC